MAPKPTIQLRTIFLIFVCVAIGLTCATARNALPEYQLSPWLSQLRPRQNLCHFFLYTGIAAIIVGLIQQICDLVQLQFPSTASQSGLRFARTFAISWRVFMAVVLSICAASQIFLVREKIQLPDHDVFQHNVFPNVLALVGAVVVLSNSCERWRLKPRLPERWWMAAMASVAGVVLLVILLRDTGMIAYLVHIAMQGIERAQAGRFQRADVYPDHEKEGFRLFWLSMWASIGAVVAAAALLIALAARNKRTIRIFCIAVYAAALAAAAAFCIWYYRIELPRVSPDYAGVGLVSNWLEQLSGVAMLATVISVAAYRWGREKKGLADDQLAVGVANSAPYFHEYAVFILLILGAPIVYLYELFRTSVNMNGAGVRLGWQQQIAQSVAEILGQPETYIYLAVLVPSLQLVWLRWKRRGNAPPLELTPIDARQFAWTWATLAMLAAVALPTFSIFAFTYWLGPWYLHGPK